ncbi:uncharacterized protein LOC112597650 [Melanaphis sacchari]|uniref:uncharacterized protein LOC112597650 n=1 Tax=Melanaphis sacchari TaxID=742174 RepID=UPI000DC14B0F|nr:uncharacterized protein LOC112597650 [Melanaphis sacchari]
MYGIPSGGTKQQVLRPRMKEITDFRIGTWNVRSLFRTGALTTSQSCLERYEMDITAIQEVRWTSSGSLKSQGMTLFYNGEDKHERGVGFIIKDNIATKKLNELQQQIDATIV